MKKSDIVDRVTGETLVTKFASETAVNTVFLAIVESFARGEDVTIDASNTVSFKVGKALKEAVNWPSGRTLSVRMDLGDFRCLVIVSARGRANRGLTGFDAVDIVRETAGRNYVDATHGHPGVLCRGGSSAVGVVVVAGSVVSSMGC